jgi:hypothetical protein
MVPQNVFAHPRARRITAQRGPLGAMVTCGVGTMSMRSRWVGVCASVTLGCGGGGTSDGGHGTSSGSGDDTSTTIATTAAASTSSSTTDASTTDDGGTTGEPDEDDRIRITHAFGELELPPQSDDVTLCASWTLDNALAVYVNEVEMANLGNFHHSNWFVVPEDQFPGEDGYWPCAERGFDEIAASSQGATVLFAQSTQSYTEAQKLAEGAVVKIPPRYKILATLHTLNASPEPSTTELWLSLYPTHPKDVTGVVTALSIQYKDLHIPPQTQSRFRASCDLSTAYWLVNQEPLAMRLHYILPHYHYLGNFFEVKVQGGLRDGEVVYSLDGFNGAANGRTFDPPLDLPGATGLSVTCGYDNWRSEEVGWGNGDGEMCVMLALIESEAIMGASVDIGSQFVGMEDGAQVWQGLCLGIGLPISEDQAMPTEQEILAPLYLPPVDPDDQGLPPVPECRDANAAVPPDGPATLSRIRDNIFAPACTFSSCHGMSAVAGLDLLAGDLHAELMEHALLADVDDPLVAPGDPDGSHLYQRLAKCEPVDDGGNVLSHMPYNAPFLLTDAEVAMVREWIAAGAADD